MFSICTSVPSRYPAFVTWALIAIIGNLCGHKVAALNTCRRPARRIANAMRRERSQVGETTLLHMLEKLMLQLDGQTQPE
jgi:hypothetical protein